MSDEDDLSRARQRRDRRRRTKPAGAFGPGPRKQIQIANAMDKVRQADRLNGPPTPERITMALNLRDLYGPEVDEALGGQEPMVDEWESGERVPTKDQIQALAMLTGFPVTFFYQPPPQPMAGMFICGDDGCRSLPEDSP